LAPLATSSWLLSAVNLRKAKKLFCALALALSFTVLTAQQQHHHHEAEGGDANAVLEKLSAVHMPISRAALVQAAPFKRGVALLHSFWYEEALKQFQSVATGDPQCAMAHWAIAMTEWRAFWGGMPDDRRRAGIAEIDEAMALHPKTDREQR
jgi:hypothetical protein